MCDLVVQSSQILNYIYDDDYYENLATEYDIKLNGKDAKEIDYQNYQDYPCCERKGRKRSRMLLCL